LGCIDLLLVLVSSEGKQPGNQSGYKHAALLIHYPKIAVSTEFLA